MDEFDRDLHDALSDEGQLDATKSDEVREEAVRMHSKWISIERDEGLSRWQRALRAILTSVTFVSMGLIFGITDSTKVMIGVAVLFLLVTNGVLYTGRVLYLVMEIKKSVLKELKELRLEVAELSEKVNSAQE